MAVAQFHLMTMMAVHAVAVHLLTAGHAVHPVHTIYKLPAITVRLMEHIICNMNIAPLRAHLNWSHLPPMQMSNPVKPFISPGMPHPAVRLPLPILSIYGTEHHGLTGIAIQTGTLIYS